ncbi:MAG: sigma-54-dependent Fis family transcriptional regulator [Bacteroidales bacterium]|nr:sigma-54-dependent Fis family transcriptional regulator [Bacteroidales bacterium]
MKELKILVIDDEKLIRWSLEKHLSSKNYTVYTAETGEEGIKIFETMHPEVVLVDNQLPKMQGLDVILKLKSLDEDVVIVFMTAYGSIETAVNAMKAGATEYINKPFAFEEIEVILDNIKTKLKIIKEIQVLRRQQKDIVTFDHIIGETAIFKQIIQLSKKIARTKTTTILLLGESGTGKDMFAHAIHNDSTRNEKPFITINCSSLPESLLESELFGHEKGAFTDAKQLKKGLFEIADGGTVFLDEIGEINLATQIKLLGVLENREVRRIGGTMNIPVDIRIIAATNRDLKKAVDDKLFREDLYYRLKVFQIYLPSLRERKDDIPLIADHFIKYYNQQFQKKVNKINTDIRNLLINYDWPGNIRELRNVIERAVILESLNTIQVDSLPGEIAGNNNEYKIHNSQPASGRPTDKKSNGIDGLNIPDTGVSLYDIEKQIIKKVLDDSHNNQTLASKMLGISRDTLRYKIKKHKL